MKKKVIQVKYDFVVIGGGLSGVCAAIAAARHGVKTALVHDRPVLGGNASSEIRMHICGAAGPYCKRKNARETGILEEILLENKRRNPNHNFSILDTVIWEKVRFQENLSLYLNCHANDIVMNDKSIVSIKAIQLTTEKNFEFQSNLFADTTGDAVIAHMAGADIMRGMEGRDVFQEPSAPAVSSNHTMGNTLMFKAYDTGKPVSFQKPFWAYSYTEEDLKYRAHSDISAGYWWIELGGLQDTIEDYEEIRDELLKVLYGVWDHIKNGGDHGAETWDLDWVQFLPGKRESRRVKGDFVLTEQDLVEGRFFEDAVAYGGWPIDTHTPMGILGGAENPNHFHDLNDLYSIPFRCLYAQNIENLFIGGRAVSASHLAFASLRIMGTTSVIGQAIGTAASLMIEDGLTPRQLYTSGKIKQLQQILLRDDCYIPGVSNNDPNDLTKKANITASSSQPEHPMEHLVTGISRPVGNDNNLWCSAEGDGSPWLRLTWEQPVKIDEVILKFDSDLDHDLMISIDKGVVDTWRSTPPPTLVKAYRLDFELDGKIIMTKTVQDNCIRNAVEKFDSPVLCDALKVSMLETYGMEQFRLFEIRVSSAQ